MANRIMLNQTSYHGAGAIAEVAAEAKSHGFKKALVCTGPTLLRHGVTLAVTPCPPSSSTSVTRAASMSLP